MPFLRQTTQFNRTRDIKTVRRIRQDVFLLFAKTDLAYVCYISQIVSYRPTWCSGSWTRGEAGESGTSFVEYWSTIWWIAFFETFDPQWRRDQKYESERERIEDQWRSRKKITYRSRRNRLWTYSRFYRYRICYQKYFFSSREWDEKNRQKY